MDSRRLRTAALVCAIALTLVPRWLHAQDDLQDDRSSSRFASLHVAFDARGSATAHLFLPATPQSPEPIQSALGKMLGCPASQFSSPQTRTLDRYRGNMNDEQWERYRRSVEEASRRQIKGTCAGVLTRDKWLEQGSIDLAPLEHALRDAGMQSLSLSLSYPLAAFHDFTATNANWKLTDDYASANVDLAAPQLPGTVALKFGVRPFDLKKAGLIGLAFILVPILIIFWMQRVTLASGGDDRVAAWFSYQRTSAWCVTAMILLWVFSDFHARQTFERFLAFRLGDETALVPLATAAIIFVPVLIVFAASVSLAYPVWVHLRQTKWNRREYLLVQLLQGGVTLLPMMFVVAGSLLLWKSSRFAIGCFVAAYVINIACSTWKMRIARTFPEAVTMGELRDKVFELARKAAVPVRQVFVLPAGKGQVANAAAAKTNIVIFTDYLLQKLSKREVDYVAAHELTHLQKKHPAKLQLAFLAALFTPAWLPWLVQVTFGLLFGAIGMVASARMAPVMAQWERGWSAFQGWMFHDLALIVAGFSGFYLLARRFEFVADAGAIALTGDPEAAISGLVKTNRLNLMPLQWGKVSGAWLTHPTTVRRIERIAALGSVTETRMHELATQTAPPSASLADEDHYPIPSSPENQVVSFAGQTARARFNLWVLITFHWLPAAATALIVEWRHWVGEARIAAFACGLAITLGFYLMVIRALGVRGRAKIEQPLWTKSRREGIAVEQYGAMTVGVSPGATPRFYVSSYNWETGVLLFTKDKLHFLGNQLRFALTRDQVLDVRLGPGAPSWITMPRTYLLWRDAEHGRDGALNLASASPCSAFDLSRQAHELCQRLTRWRQGAMSQAAIPQLADLASPALGEVTSVSPKTLTTPAKSMKTLLLILPVAIAGCVLLRVEAIGYVVLSTVMVRIFEMIPHWRYKERLVYAPKSAAEALAGTAAAGTAR